MKGSEKPGIIINPSILSCDFTKLGSQITRLIEGGADWLHLDIMDGHFVQNISIGFPVVKSIRKAFPDVFLDCHCMIANPQKYLDTLQDSGASQVIFHMEALANPEGMRVFQLSEDVQRISVKLRQRCIKSALALSPLTQIKPWLLKFIEEGGLDMVLVMTVRKFEISLDPGFGGQRFLEEPLEKVKLIRQIAPTINIEVDGGVKIENIHKAAESGANVFVSGTGILKGEDWALNIKELREKASL